MCVLCFHGNLSSGITLGHGFLDKPKLYTYLAVVGVGYCVGMSEAVGVSLVSMATFAMV